VKTPLPTLLAIGWALVPFAPAQDAAEKPARQPPVEIALLDAPGATASAIAGLKQEGFRGAALLLDEGFTAAEHERAVKLIVAASLDLYYWIEVGRNPRLAEAHPRWMASLGMHKDWQKGFPNVPLPKEGEVAKAFPWVPIWYQEAFEAHLRRIEQLLQRASPAYRGLFLNDLQGGPSSCGCGNLQCRWATDYHVPATGTQLAGDDAAARFVAAVRQQTRKEIIPVWATECEEGDLPAKQRPAGRSTGKCGTVGCAAGTCPKAFTRQWSALVGAHHGTIALLGLHLELNRTDAALGEGPDWVARAVAYVDGLPPQNDGPASGQFSHGKLWLVVQGATREEESTARRAAIRSGAGGVVVARARIDQSFEPRVLPVK